MKNLRVPHDADVKKEVGKEEKKEEKDEAGASPVVEKFHQTLTAELKKLQSQIADLLRLKPVADNKIRGENTKSDKSVAIDQATTLRRLIQAIEKDIIKRIERNEYTDASFSELATRYKDLELKTIPPAERKLIFYDPQPVFSTIKSERSLFCGLFSSSTPVTKLKRAGFETSVESSVKFDDFLKNMNSIIQECSDALKLNKQAAPERKGFR